MARELIQARADEDTIDNLEEFADETGISKSEAVRRSIRYYLSMNGYEYAEADGGIPAAIDGLEESVSSRLANIESKQSNEFEELEQELVTRTSRDPAWLQWMNVIVLVLVTLLLVLELGI
jgi:metal-responsive CopG/Arc/MetJ family transcriptional regulator